VSFDSDQDRPWLVVDDLGAKRLTDRAAEASARGPRLSSTEVLSQAVLFRVFNMRYTARAHTLVASNVRPEEVPEPRLRREGFD
jgi:hypothetical protein